MLLSASTVTHKKKVKNKKPQLPLINRTVSCSFHLARQGRLARVRARNPSSDSARVVTFQLEWNQNVSSADNHSITAFSRLLNNGLTNSAEKRRATFRMSINFKAHHGFATEIEIVTFFSGARALCFIFPCQGCFLLSRRPIMPTLGSLSIHFLLARKTSSPELLSSCCAHRLQAES